MRPDEETVFKLPSMFDSVHLMSGTTEVWTLKKSESYGLFTVSFIDSQLKFCTECIAC